MGRFRDEGRINTEYKPIVNWLTKRGFEFGDNSGPRDEKGFTKVYSVDEIYSVWVTIDLEGKKIYIYKEYDCGGKIGDDEINIEEEWLSSLNSFIDNVDSELETWIG